MQSCLHCFRPQPEQPRGFLDAHVLDQPCHQDDAERLRQRIDRAFQKAMDFVLGHFAFGIELRGRERDDLRVRKLRVRDAVPVDRDASPAEPPIGFVDRDPGQPGAELRFAAEIGELRESPHIRFLHDILGLVVVFHDRADQTKKPAIVVADDGPHRRLVARTYPGGQSVFGGKCGPRLFFGHGCPSFPLSGIRCGPGTKVPTAPGALRCAIIYRSDRQSRYRINPGPGFTILSRLRINCRPSPHCGIESRWERQLERSCIALWLARAGSECGLSAAELLPTVTVVLAGRHQGRLS